MEVPGHKIIPAGFVKQVYRDVDIRRKVHYGVNVRRKLYRDVNMRRTRSDWAWRSALWFCQISFTAIMIREGG